MSFTDFLSSIGFITEEPENAIKFSTDSGNTFMYLYDNKQGINDELLMAVCFNEDTTSNEELAGICDDILALDCMSPEKRKLIEYYVQEELFVVEMTIHKQGIEAMLSAVNFTLDEYDGVSDNDNPFIRHQKVLLYLRDELGDILKRFNKLTVGGCK